MSKQEGLGHQLSDSRPLLNCLTDAAQALDTRLTEKIDRETRERENFYHHKLSPVLANLYIVREPTGNFILQKDHLLAARPSRVVHRRKMITSSAYRDSIRKTKERFGSTSSTQIKRVLNEEMDRLSEELKSIHARQDKHIASQTRVRSCLQDLRKIEQQMSEMALPSTSIDHRASI
ncbi:hypothetical protein [Burkholderia ambifaria]|nr:hypothetical protein [Burkholderia ambifaria]